MLYEVGKVLKSKLIPRQEYEQEDFIDRGGEGQLVKAKVREKNLRVALKLYENEITAKHLQILFVLFHNKSALKHLIEIIDLLQEDKAIVMELADGSLASLIKNDEFKKQDRIKKNQYFYQIVEGVEELHSLGYFHCDLKPENIVYMAQEEKGSYLFKLCDYGLVRSIKYVSDNSALINNNDSLGDKGNGAPEMVTQKYDESVDIWGLGVIWCNIFGFEKIEKLKKKGFLQKEISQYIETQAHDLDYEKMLILKMLRSDPKQRIKLKELKTELYKHVYGVQLSAQVIQELSQPKELIKSINKPGTGYFKQQLIGYGPEGLLYKGMNVTNQQRVTIMISEKASNDEISVLRSIMQTDSEYIVKILELIIRQNQVIIIMDSADGYFSELILSDQYKVLDRKYKNQHFLQITKGVKDLHNLNLVHRDLRFENIIFQRINQDTLRLKVCHFGFLQQQMNKMQVKNEYQAPEIFNSSNFTNKIDIWALGMMWFELLSGRPLLTCDSVDDLQNKIRNLDDQKVNSLLNISNLNDWELQIFQRILVVSPFHRISAKELIQCLEEGLNNGQLFIEDFSKLNIDQNDQYSYSPKQAIHYTLYFQNKQQDNITKDQSRMTHPEMIQELKNKFEEAKQQMELEKSQEIKKLLLKVQQEAEKEQQSQLKQKEQMLEAERQNKEIELQKLQLQNLNYQQELLQIQIDYDNEIYEFKLQQQEETRRQIKIREEELTKMLEFELKEKIKTYEETFKKEVESQILQQQKQEFEEKERELQIQCQQNIQQAFREKKQIALTYLKISIELLKNQKQVIQQKKIQKTISTDEYDEQIKIYLGEIKQEKKKIKKDQETLSILDFQSQYSMETISNYVTQYSQHGERMIQIQGQRINNLAYLYKQIVDKMELLNQEKIEQRESQEQLETLIKQQKNSLNQQLNNLDQYYEKLNNLIQQKQKVLSFYGYFDDSKQLGQMISEIKQQVDMFKFVKMNTEFLLQFNNDHQSFFCFYEHTLIQLSDFERFQNENQQYSKIKQIEQKIEDQILNQKNNCLDEIEEVFETFDQNYHNYKSHAVIQLKWSIGEQLNNLNHKKLVLQNHQNLTTMDFESKIHELEKIISSKNQCQQIICQIKKLSEKLGEMIAYETILKQLNEEKDNLIKKAKEKLSSQISEIFNLIKKFEELQTHSTQNIQQSVFKKIFYLQQIHIDAESKFYSMTQIKEFQEIQEFNKLKIDLDEFGETLQKQVQAEKKYFWELSDRFQNIMSNQKTESQLQIFYAQRLYKKLSENVHSVLKKYDELDYLNDQYPIKQFQKEKENLDEDIQNLQEMLKKGDEEQILLTEKINQKNKYSLQISQKSIAILRNLNTQQKENLKNLQDQISYCCDIQKSLIKDFHIDLQKDLDKLANEKSQYLLISQQMEADFSNLNNQKDKFNFGQDSILFIQKYECINVNEQMIQDQVSNLEKRIKEVFECLIIIKILRLLIKLYHTKRFAQRLLHDSKKTKEMSDTQKIKLFDKIKQDQCHYSTILEQEKAQTNRYRCMLEQKINLDIKTTKTTIENTYEDFKKYEEDLLEQIKIKNLVKLRKQLKQEKTVKSIIQMIDQLEFCEYKILNKFQDN